jgi:hypothetical protein
MNQQRGKMARLAQDLIDGSADQAVLGAKPKSLKANPFARFARLVSLFLPPFLSLA